MAGSAGLNIPISASVAASGTATATNNFGTTINFGAGYIDDPFNPSITPESSATAVASQGGDASAAPVASNGSGGLLGNLSSKDATIIFVLAGIAGIAILGAGAYLFTHR